MQVHGSKTFKYGRQLKVPLQAGHLTLVRLQSGAVTATEGVQGRNRGPEGGDVQAVAPTQPFVRPFLRGVGGGLVAAVEAQLREDVAHVVARAVFSLTTSFAAISLFVAPSAMRVSTSRRAPSGRPRRRWGAACRRASTTPFVTFESSSDSRVPPTAAPRATARGRRSSARILPRPPAARRRPFPPANDVSISTFVAGSSLRTSRQAAMPSMPSIRTSISTMSGWCARAFDRVSAVRRFGDHSKVRLDFERRAKAHPYHLVVIDDHQPRLHESPPIGTETLMCVPRAGLAAHA